MTKKRDTQNQIVAESEGFEPTVGINPQQFSRLPHSTALPTLPHSHRQKGFKPALVSFLHEHEKYHKRI